MLRRGFLRTLIGLTVAIFYKPVIEAWWRSELTEYPCGTSTRYFIRMNYGPVQELDHKQFFKSVQEFHS